MEYSYVVLWSILEMLLGDSKRIENKLKGLYKHDAVDQIVLIEALYYKRNILLHQGRIEVISLEDVNYLRIVAQDLLMFTLRTAKTLRNTYEIGEALLSMREFPKILESSKVS
jgi:hypothetical protein